MSEGMGVLGEIVARTRARIEQRRSAFPLESLRSHTSAPEPRRPFREALRRPGRMNVIAEFKRRSPSRGSLRQDLPPQEVARAYERAGAAALSVLTEEEFFGGSLDDLRQARSATALPTLRKDFVVDPYQVQEARVAGADAVLLIVAALSDRELSALCSATAEAGLEALVEVHDRGELERALAAGAGIVGVNNRNLKTLEVRLTTCLELRPHVPDGIVTVAESGIRDGADIRRLREAGFDAFLVGEHLMTSTDPGAALEALLSEATRSAERRAR